MSLHGTFNVVPPGLFCSNTLPGIACCSAAFACVCDRANTLCLCDPVLASCCTRLLEEACRYQSILLKKSKESPVKCDNQRLQVDKRSWGVLGPCRQQFGFEVSTGGNKGANSQVN